MYAIYELDFEIQSLDDFARFFEFTWRGDSLITFYEPLLFGGDPVRKFETIC